MSKDVETEGCARAWAEDRSSRGRPVGAVDVSELSPSPRGDLQVTVEYHRRPTVISKFVHTCWRRSDPDQLWRDLDSMLAACLSRPD